MGDELTVVDAELVGELVLVDLCVVVLVDDGVVVALVVPDRVAVDVTEVATVEERELVIVVVKVDEGLDVADNVTVEDGVEDAVLVGEIVRVVVVV